MGDVVLGKEGWLTKFAAEIKAQKLWFFIECGVLLYSSSETKVDIIGRIELKGCKVNEDPENRIRFELVAEDRTYNLYASNEEEMKSWVEALRSEIEKRS
uniref:PH domain-containing protein n=1 Tax=Paramoeba aestuarina TaxID=180227 RepID=A0A7S4KUS1_9EUKA|mmetsp:Transcript_25826/g.40302  ORF Transcript_25826/g.40302 Transcript_25826/m.40302 type:complete len:100 (+) Transcript_25826:60-359(+)